MSARVARPTLERVPGPTSRRSWHWLVGVVAAVQLAVGVTVAANPRLLDDERARRVAAVRALLQQRADALLRRDRAGFLATVDPAAPALRRQQAAVFDALQSVPLSVWRYDLLPSAGTGSDAGWSPGVTLRYALAGFDQVPTAQEQQITFVRRGRRWYVGGQATGARAPHLWDGGPVQVQRSPSCLVLAHPTETALARELVRTCQAAVPFVSAVWGTGWSQRVVIELPASVAELTALVPQAGELRQIAAVATAELQSGPGSQQPVSFGDRVLVNPEAFPRLSPAGRRVVLRHEIAHVATRPVTLPSTPEWLVEGLADYIGYLGSGISEAVSAAELRADVRAGRLPAGLPGDADFTGTRGDLPQTYEQSWLAVSLLVDRFGTGPVLRLYRRAGSGDLDAVMRETVGIGVDELTALWRDDLRRRFR